MPFALVMLLFVSSAQAPAPDVKTLFESGAYDEVVAEVDRTSTQDPDKVYLAALSQQKLAKQPDAVRLLTILANRGEEDAWRAIGQSALRLNEGNLDAALAASSDAIELAVDLCQAQYQHGLVLSAKQDFGGAAVAFEKAATADPRWAYAHYYAGMAHQRMNRVDLMAKFFESFLKLAPNAPERGQVESIMRTIRGR